MTALAGFVLTLFAAAMICGILEGIGKQTGFHKLLKLLCGLFLMLAVLLPVSRLSFEDISPFAMPYIAEGEQAAQAGEDYAKTTLAEIIKAETQAYILDKATQIGACVTAEVTVSDDPVPIPVAVRITGQVSDRPRQELVGLITNDLNIAKENQTWTG